MSYDRRAAANDGAPRVAAARGGLVLALVVSVVTAAPAWAGMKTCLTGTDPSVAADAGQIAAVRTLIEAACMCTTFDGSSDKTHGKYVTCAGSVIAAQVGAGQLRTQCKGTVKKYYATSTCGIPASKGVVSCIKKTATGKVTCAIKPSAKCVDSAGNYTQAACGAFSLCIDAADTSHDALIGPDDSGVCAAVPVATQTVPSGSTPTRTFTPRPPGAPTLTPTPPGPTHTHTRTPTAPPVCCDAIGGALCIDSSLGGDQTLCASQGGTLYVGGLCACSLPGPLCFGSCVAAVGPTWTPTRTPTKTPTLTPTRTFTPGPCGLDQGQGSCSGACSGSGTTCQGIYDNSGIVACVCGTCAQSSNPCTAGSCAGAGTCTYVNLFNSGCLCFAPTPTPVPHCCDYSPIPGACVQTYSSCPSGTVQEANGSLCDGIAGTCGQVRIIGNCCQLSNYCLEGPGDPTLCANSGGTGFFFNTVCGPTTHTCGGQ